MNSPIQKILFGSPGTGKSFKIDNEIIPKTLKIDKEKHPENVIKTVFHPEYTYGDFVGKLMPLTTSDGKVEYKFYEGHFLKALAQAYTNFLSKKEEEEVKNVALVIDEINRGNSSAIFGTIFQLLDRREDGWSDYGINLSDLEFQTIIGLIGFRRVGEENKIPTYSYGKHTSGRKLEEYQEVLSKINIKVEKSKVIGSSILIPPNLSILGTMNTSDNSIYFMDSAFKRRWDWEFINWDKSVPPPGTYGGAKNGTFNKEEWLSFIRKLNIFIKKYHAFIRGIEDKQVGEYFIKERPVTAENIQNKLMFFLWDSVFHRDKRPLVELLGVTRDELVTFGDFTKRHNSFVEKIININ
ncbi:putative endonuclease [Calothrix brevissima NIES-22]|nr:putative endonuclease [Calothrix brevissima NIES-22]